MTSSVIAVAVVTDGDMPFCGFITTGTALYSMGKRDAYRGSNRGRVGDGITIIFLVADDGPVIIRFVDVVANCGVDVVEEAYVDTVPGVKVEDDDDSSTHLFLFIGVICFGVP
jgi:hypothetical protein